MAKDLIANARTYAKNVAGRLGQVLRGEERAGKALAQIGRDSRKLSRALVHEPEEEDTKRKRAVRFTKAGRKHYNAKNYEEAEKHFRHAAVEDPSYSTALLYLGHTLYQLNRGEEAVSAWQRAYDADPHGEDGRDALKKINHVRKQKSQFRHVMENRTGKSR